MDFDESTFAQLESTLGLDFISYCTASSKEDLSARFTGKTQLLDAAEIALAKLANLSSQIVSHSTNNAVPTDFLWDIFGIFDADEHLPLASIIRRDAGGQIHVPHSSDSLIDKLKKIAVNVFPLLLLPPSNELPLPHISLTRPLKSYPISSPTVDAILGDDGLSKLHPHIKLSTEAPPRMMIELAVYRTIESIILYAFNKAILKSPTVPSVQDFCREIRGAVTTAQCMIRGDSVLLPVAIGLANIELPSEAIMEFKFGRISEYHRIFDRWAPSQLRNDRVVQTSDQGEHEFIRGGNIVLHMEQRIRFKMNRVSEKEGSFSWRSAAVDGSELPTRQSVVCLAATLSISYDPPIAVNPTWTATFSPIIPGAWTTWREISKHTMAPLRAITRDEVEAWKYWISTISAVGLGGVDIAARRIQAAIAERDNQVDRFVDSVVAWENLFGGDGEMTLRISSSLAWLLGDDAKHRLELQKKIKDLYTLRSKVVHGAKHLDDGDAAVSATSGLKIAINALREIYTKHPQLVSLDGTKRSVSMILQADL
jgi:hypothetical protein